MSKIVIYIYMYISVLSKLTQIPFNSTNFINARLTQRIFSVSPMAQPLVGEMEMHSITNLATMQTPLATFFPKKKTAQTLFSLQESLVLSREFLLSQHALTSLSHSTTIVLILWVFYLIRQWLDYKDFCAD